MKQQRKQGQNSENRYGRQPESVGMQRSTINRSSGLKTSFASGLLIPIFVDEALPGDTLQLKMTSFTRMATAQAPVMDNLYLDFFFFAIPNRLLWDNWERFMGARTGVDVTEFVLPNIGSAPGGGWNEASMGDYFGLPTKIDFTEPVNALPFRSYNFVFNEWFRDNNVQLERVFETGDGPDIPQFYEILRRNKRHDYFTSCLPWPQAPGPGQNFTSDYMAKVVPDQDTSGIPSFDYTGGTGVLMADNNNNDVRLQGDPVTSDSDMSWNESALAAQVSINELREAFQIHKMFERDARGGRRYTELLQSHFGVVSDDARQQRPEYLGGGTVNININPVNVTAEGDGRDPGDLAAFTTGHGMQHGFNKSFTEHCTILGLASVRADLNYQQGIERMWSRRTRFDYYWPALAHLGEQPVYNREIYVDGTDDDNDVFGYQERWAEYRYKPSKVTGSMRSNADGSLDIWHLAQDFGSRPVLNETFLEERPAVSRVLYREGVEEFLMDAFFEYKCTRPMPVYSVPGLVDHF